MGAISICLGLRAKEAVTLSFRDGSFFWHGAKGRAGECSETAIAWGAQWGHSSPLCAHATASIQIGPLGPAPVPSWASGVRLGAAPVAPAAPLWRRAAPYARGAHSRDPPLGRLGLAADAPGLRLPSGQLGVPL